MHPFHTLPEHQDHEDKPRSSHEDEESITSDFEHGPKRIGTKGDDVVLLNSGIVRWCQSSDLNPAVKANGPENCEKQAEHTESGADENQDKFCEKLRHN